MADDFKALIAKVATGASLSREEAASAFDRMMSGEATPSQMGGLLMALRVRGETVDEITGAVTTMRAKMLGVKAPPGAVDVVGTGGDASGSFNISTCAAFIVAGDRLLVLNVTGDLLVGTIGAEAWKPEKTYEVAESATWAHPALLGDRILIKDRTSLTLWSFQRR